MKYIGTEEELIDNGFEYVVEFNAFVRGCKYTRDGQLYKDIFCINKDTKLAVVDIPKYCTEDVFREVAADLIEKGLLVEDGPIAREPSVRAKFECINAFSDEYTKMTFVSFMPVVNGSEENKMFSGTVNMCINNDYPATTAFEAGAEYYVDFTKVEKVK